MKLLIKIPSRQRSEKLLTLLDNLKKMCSSDNEIHCLISCDHDDTTMNNDDIKSKLADHDLFFGNRSTKIEAANRDMEKISVDWDILIALDDDMMPVVKNYDRYISEGFETYFPDFDGALWFFDGHQNHLLTYAVMGKTYYKRFDYIYHPSYKGFYCDNEFQEVAWKLGKLQRPFWPLCIIEHQHYGFMNDTTKDRWNGADSLYRENFSAFGKDRENYLNRKNRNFDL